MKSEKKKGWLSKKPKLRKFLIISSIVLGVSILAFAGVFAYKLQSTSDKIHTKTTVSTKRTKEVSLAKVEPFSVLLLGVDKRPKSNDKGRSDTIIIATVNPKLKSVKMLSIPRDTRVKIPGRTGFTKINAAYAYGGPQLAMKTVEDLFDVPIDYFVQVDFLGFRQLVDAIGEIEIYNSRAFSQSGIHFKVGNLHLNGKEALAYVRMRHQDPRGDYGRQLRQQEAIKSIANEVLSFKSITRFNAIFDAVGDNVRTNLTLSELWDIKSNYAESTQNIQSLQVEQIGRMINGSSYQLVLYNERMKMRSILREHLGLSVDTAPSFTNNDAAVTAGESRKSTSSSSKTSKKVTTPVTVSKKNQTSKTTPPTIKDPGTVSPPPTSPSSGGSTTPPTSGSTTPPADESTTPSSIN